MFTSRAFLMHTATDAVTGAASVHAPQAATDEPARSKTSVKTDAHADSAVSRTKPKDKVVRLAIVGTGQISHRYLKQVAGSTRARFVATCARTLASAKARGLEYGIDAWFDDYLAMYEAIAPDAVVVATPAAVHAAPTIAALERGIHVLCEKPMAMTFEDCRAMVDAAERSGAIFLGLPYDAQPSVLAALAHLNENTLGVFMGAEAQLLFPGTSRADSYDSKAGVGGAIESLVYPVSRLISLFGPARRVSGFVNTLIPHRILGDLDDSEVAIDLVPPSRRADHSKIVESTVADNATLVLEWAGGQQALVRTLWSTSIVRIDAIIYGRHGTLWIAGNDVVIHSPERAIPGATAVTWGNYTNCYRVPVRAQDWPRDEGLIEHFVDCIEGRDRPTCSGPQALHVHEILFKGYEAARSGRTQELETTFTPWHRIDPAFHDTRSRPI